MEWIAVSVGVSDDPGIHALADDCDVDVATAVGLFVGVLCKLPAHAEDGNVSAVRASTLEAWAHWRGARGVFAAAFLRHFTDDAGVVKAWERWNGANLREAKASRDRSRKFREARKAAAEQARTEKETARHGLPAPDTHSSTPGTETPPRTRTERVANPEPNAFGTRSERVANASTRQDKTGQDKTELRNYEQQQIAPAVAVAPVPPNLPESADVVPSPLRGTHEPRTLSETSSAAVVSPDGTPTLFPDLVPAPAATTSAPASSRPTNGKGPVLDRLRTQWAARVGVPDPAVFGRRVSPALDAFTEAQIAAAIDAFGEVRDAVNGRDKQFRTLTKFCDDLAEYVRLGAMPITDANGAPTERGRRGVLNFTGADRA